MLGPGIISPGAAELLGRPRGVIESYSSGSEQPNRMSA